MRIVLDNDAALLLSLTYEGSPRLGVRDHCKFRGGSSTVTVVDSEFYISESSRGVTRKLRTRRLQAHRQMYRSIAAALMSGKMEIRCIEGYSAGRVEVQGDYG
jgi:hypothetical protein